MIKSLNKIINNQFRKIKNHFNPKTMFIFENFLFFENYFFKRLF